MYDAFTTMLETYHIVPRKYFEGTLVGGDIVRLLHNHSAICVKATAIFKNVQLRKLDADDDVDDQIDAFIVKMKDLLCVFECIYSLMSQTTQLSEEDIQLFSTYCRRFGMMMRYYFPGCNIPPKLHALESHAPYQMRMFGCLGDKMEAAIERLHQLCNKANRLFAAVPSWQKRHLARLVRVSRGEAAGVDEVIEERLVGTKRKYSHLTNVRRGNKIIATSAAMRTKLDVASNVCIAFANEFNLE